MQLKQLVHNLLVQELELRNLSYDDVLDKFRQRVDTLRIDVDVIQAHPVIDPAIPAPPPLPALPAPPAPPPIVNMAPLQGKFAPKLYNGSQTNNANLWIESFDTFAAFSEWNAARKVQALPIFLTGAALSWHTALGVHGLNWAELRAAFLERFPAKISTNSM